MESLEARLDECDFGLFVFSADDVARIRGKHVFITRDNTIFETGLFWGKLRRKRVFCLIPQEIEVSDGEHIKGLRVDKLHLLSDLTGMTLLEYEYPHDEEYRAAVSVPCREIADIIEEEQFFFDPAVEFLRKNSMAKFFWEYHRLLPLTVEASLTQKFHAISEGIGLSFLAPTFAGCSVTHVAIFEKHGDEGLGYVAGNMGEGDIFTFGNGATDEEKPAVIEGFLDTENFRESSNSKLSTPILTRYLQLHNSLEGDRKEKA